MSDNHIQKIQAKDLCRMGRREGLVLQGCGGDPQEWLDGINELLTENDILLRGSRFENIFVFENNGCTNILFDFADVDVDIGKLAMWRLATHEIFGGTWLSDYVEIHLGGFSQAESAAKKPPCPLIGQDGNIFNLVGIAASTLREAGLRDQAKELTHRILGGECHSYGEALRLIGEYVEIIDDHDHSGNNPKKGAQAHER